MGIEKWAAVGLSVLVMIMHGAKCEDVADTQEEQQKKTYILYIILGGLICFLVLAAFIIETLLSKSKRDESKKNEQEKLREQYKEKTQIESNIMWEPSTIKKDGVAEPIYEENSDRESVK